MIKFVLLFMAFLVINTASSSETLPERIRSYSVYTDSVMNPFKMNLIADRYEVVKKLLPGYEVYVQEKDVQSFLSIVPNAKLLQKDIHSQLFSDKSNLDKYRTYSQVEIDLKSLAAKFKNLTTLETYGVTAGGRNLYALKISTGDAQNKPKMMMTAATHGDELITTEVLFALTNELLSGYGKDERLSKILNSREIYIIPVVSPDSFEKRNRYVGLKDPNRSYPWPENANNGGVDCINAMMDFTNKNKFNASLDMHAYGKLVMYPWGYTKESPDRADEVMFSDLVQSMARENNYQAGQISTTIYVAKGSSADYFYWKTKTKAIAVEIGTQKVPDYSKIPDIVNESREMVWTFLENIN